MTDVKIPFDENLAEQATLLLAAAEDAGLEQDVVRTVSGHFVVPEEILEHIDTDVKPEPVDPDPTADPTEEPTAPTEEPTPETVEEPKGNASKDAWAEFARTKGATDEEIENSNRNELAAKYGTKDKE